MNRAIDATLRAFSWADLEALIRAAGLMRPHRYLRKARQLARQAIAEWPGLLVDAPQWVRRAVTERLHGGVALTA
nr:hypothetical protein [Cupriavidus gilardii]